MTISPRLEARRENRHETTDTGDNMMTRKKKIFDRFESYSKATEAYQQHVAAYGCTRMEWGFGKWLWLDEIPGESSLDYWKRLSKIGILTQAGEKKLAACRKAQQQKGCDHV